MEALYNNTMANIVDNTRNPAFRHEAFHQYTENSGVYLESFAVYLILIYSWLQKHALSVLIWPHDVLELLE